MTRRLRRALRLVKTSPSPSRGKRAPLPLPAGTRMQTGVFPNELAKAIGMANDFLASKGYPFFREGRLHKATEAQGMIDDMVENIQNLVVDHCLKNLPSAIGIASLVSSVVGIILMAVAYQKQEEPSNLIRAALVLQILGIVGQAYAILSPGKTFPADQARTILTDAVTDFYAVPERDADVSREVTRTDIEDFYASTRESQQSHDSGTQFFDTPLAPTRTPRPPSGTQYFDTPLAPTPATPLSAVGTDRSSIGSIPGPSTYSSSGTYNPSEPPFRAYGTECKTGYRQFSPTQVPPPSDVGTSTTVKLRRKENPFLRPEVQAYIRANPKEYQRERRHSIPSLSSDTGTDLVSDNGTDTSGGSHSSGWTDIKRRLHNLLQITSPEDTLHRLDPNSMQMDMDFTRVSALLAAVIATATGLTPTKMLTTYTGFSVMGRDIKDMSNAILWDLFGIDAAGTHELDKVLAECEKEGLKIDCTPPQETSATGLKHLRNWIDQVQDLLPRLEKEKHSRLFSLFNKLKNKYSEIKQNRDNGDVRIPTPVMYYFWSTEGIGKTSYIANLLVPSLAKAANSPAVDSRIYNLNSGKYSGPYSNEKWAFCDEFGASTNKEQDNSFYNQLCSGYPAMMPGASLETKNQVAKFTGIFLAGNASPRMTNFGMKDEVRRAFMSRTICVEVTDPLYTSGNRMDHPHRRPDFAHLKMDVYEYNVHDRQLHLAHRCNGAEFVDLVAKQINKHQENFRNLHGDGTKQTIIACQPLALAEEQSLTDEVREVVTADIPMSTSSTASAKPPVTIPLDPIPLASQRPRPDAGNLLNQTFRRSRPDPFRKQNATGMANRVTLYSGEPGIGKSLRITPYIKKLAEERGQLVYPLKDFSITEIAPGSIVLFDDVVDPTHPDTVEAYSKWYNIVEGKGLEIIIISNYGPYPGPAKWTDYRWRHVKQWFWWLVGRNGFRSVSMASPAFARRFGASVQLPHRRFVMLPGLLTYDPVHDFTIPTMDSLSSYMQDTHYGIILHKDVPDVPPFTRDQADVWLDVSHLGNRPTVTEFIAEGRSVASMRAIGVIGLLHPLTVVADEQSFIAVWTNVISVIPDMKFYVKMQDKTIIAEGRDIYVTQGGLNERVVEVSISGVSCAEVSSSEVTKVITPDDWWNMRTGSHQLVDPWLIKTYIKWMNYEPRLIAQVDRIVLTWSSRWMLAATRAKQSFLLRIKELDSKQPHSTCIRLAAVFGIAMAGYYTWRKLMPIKEVPVVPAEAPVVNVSQKGRANNYTTRLTVAVTSKRGNKTAICSNTDTDKRVDDWAEEDRQELNDFRSAAASGQVQWSQTDNGGRWVGKYPKASGGTGEVYMDWNRRHMTWDPSALQNKVPESDPATKNMAWVEIDYSMTNPVIASFKEKLCRNLVAIRWYKQTATATSYAMMLTPEIGVAPLHTVDDDMEVCWDLDGKTFSCGAVPFYKDPDREAAFFALKRPGPFANMTKHLLNFDKARAVKQASMLVPTKNRKGEMVLEYHTNPYQIQCTMGENLVGDLRYWGTNAGLLQFGTAETPTGAGSCGSPVFWTDGSSCFLIGVHAAFRFQSHRAASVVVTSELWNDAVQTAHSSDVEVAQSASSIDLALQDVKEAEFPVYTPLTLELRTQPPKEDLFKPHGPRLRNVGYVPHRFPHDTAGKKYVIQPIEAMASVFETSKVPSKTEKELIAEKVPLEKDANGKEHLAYARMKTLNGAEHTFPFTDGKVEVLARSLAKAVMLEHGVDTPIAPLTLDDAIAGNHFVEPMKRKTAVGVTVALLTNGARFKEDVVDYDNATRKVTWKHQIIKDLTELQWRMMRTGKRLDLPGNVGLKSELLNPAKLGRKRVFMIVGLCDFLNQKRLLAPIQQALTKDLSSRFSLSMDLILDWDEWYREFTSLASWFAAFDFKDFDFSLLRRLLTATGHFFSEFYLHLDKKKPTALACRVLMDKVATARFFYGQHLLEKEDGMQSGIWGTSLTDSSACLIALFLIYVDEDNTITADQFLANVKTRHAGDDVVIGVSDHWKDKLSPPQIAEKFHKLFGMRATPASKEGEIQDWSGPRDLAFCSRTFMNCPEHPRVMISKLKEESIAGAMRYSASKDPEEQLQTLEDLSWEVVPYGREKYDKYYSAVRAFCVYHGLRNPVKAYSEALGALFTAVITKVRTERFDKSLEFWKHTYKVYIAEPPSFGFWKRFSNTVSIGNMSKSGFKRAQRLFSDYLKEAKTSLDAVLESPLAKDFGALIAWSPDAKSEQKVPTIPLKLPSYPVNSPWFWGVMILGTDEAPDNMADWAMRVVAEWTASDDTIRKAYDANPTLAGWAAVIKMQGISKILSARIAGTPTGPKSLAFVKKWAFDEDLEDYESMLAVTMQALRMQDVNTSQMDNGERQAPAARAASTGGGASQQPLMENLDTGAVTATEAPVVIGGALQAPSVVLESFGGIDHALLPRGGFMNSMLAPMMMYTPLMTINVGTSTTEGAVLATVPFAPWDPSSVGTWIARWANQHKYFTGSFEYCLEVASAGTLLGKIAVYWIPMRIDQVPSTVGRDYLTQFQHVIIDLQQPSAQSLLVRGFSDTWMYLRDDLDNYDGGRFGHLLIRAYTDIQNTFGADVSPPVILSVKMGPDAMYTFPAIDAGTKDRSMEHPAPKLPSSGLLVTDGRTNSNEKTWDNVYTPLQAGNEWVNPLPRTNVITTPEALTEATGKWVYKNLLHLPSDNIEQWSSLLQEPDGGMVHTPHHDADGVFVVPDSANTLAHKYCATGIGTFPPEWTIVYNASLTTRDGSTMLGKAEASETSDGLSSPFILRYNGPPVARVHLSGARSSVMVDVEVDNLTLQHISGNDMGGLGWGTTGRSTTGLKEAGSSPMIAPVRINGLLTCTSGLPIDTTLPPGWTQVLVVRSKTFAPILSTPIPLVVPGVTGASMIPDPTMQDFLLDVGLQLRYIGGSYTYRLTTVDGFTSIYLVANGKGLWTRGAPLHGVCMTDVGSMKREFITYNKTEFPQVADATADSFLSRTTAQRTWTGQDPSTAQMEAGVSVLGGLFGGIGAGMTAAAQNAQFEKLTNMKLKNARDMQDKALKQEMARQRLGQAFSIQLQDRRMAATAQAAGSVGNMASAPAVSPRGGGPTAPVSYRPAPVAAVRGTPSAGPAPTVQFSTPPGVTVRGTTTAVTSV